MGGKQPFAASAKRCATFSKTDLHDLVHTRHLLLPRTESATATTSLPGRACEVSLWHSRSAKTGSLAREQIKNKTPQVVLFWSTAAHILRTGATIEGDDRTSSAIGGVDDAP